MSVTYEELKMMNKENKLGILNKKDLKKLPDLISDDETVLDLILSNIKNQALLVLTNKRILFVQSKTGFGILGMETWDIPINKINSIDVKLKGIYGEFIFYSAGNHKVVEKLPLARTSAFKNSVEKIIANKISTLRTVQENGASNGDYILEIKKLKELLDENVITQSDFDLKKKELLRL